MNLTLTSKRKHNLIIKLFLIVICAIFVSATTSAQTKVSGVVTETNGTPMVGVNIIVKGTYHGTVTDIDGNYTIDVPKDGILVFSLLGMKTQEISVGKKNNINVLLEEDINLLDDVVVVGYGSQKKAHLTGSVSVVSNKDILKSVTSNITQSLVGKLPGLISKQATGAPGSDDATLMIRGYSSYNNAGGPLMLVDGVERPMEKVDPNDVESVTVLKDAASCAVYGMKGASGVILVTTKRGREGNAVVSYRGNLTTSQPTKLPQFMNGTQYMEYYNYARYLDGLPSYFTDEEIAMTSNGDPTDGYENTNWLSPIYKNTFMQQHNLSVSGGAKNVNYYISGGYNQQDGFIKGHRNTRGNVRSNIDITPLKNLKISLNLAGLITNYNEPGADGYANQTTNNVVGALMYSAPFVPKEYQGLPAAGYRNASNPLYAADHSGFNKTVTNKIESSAEISYSIPGLKGLKVGVFGSWDWQDRDNKRFAYTYKVMLYNHGTKKYVYQNSYNLTEEGYLFQGNQKDRQYLLRPSITYNNTFNKHTVGAQLIYEMTDLRYSTINAIRTSFPLFDLPEIDLGEKIDPSNGNGGTSTHAAYAGYVGRLNYVYDEKYLAEVAFRYDGSYNFPAKSRWGLFPSASLGWVMSNEEFFKTSLTKIDRLKLRVSAGMLGRDNTDPFLYLKSYAVYPNNVVMGNDLSASNTIYNNVSYPNTSLSWEKCTTYNAGFELSAFQGLIGVEADVFYKYTFDILQSSAGTYPPSLGGRFPSIENSGIMDAKGFELVLKHTNKISEVMYNINGNISFARNRILKKTQADNTLPWQNVLGQSIGLVYGLKAEGLFQTQEEIDNAPIPPSTQPRIGDIKYKDIDGDGRITQYDNVFIGRSAMPELMYSVTGDVYWKGFSLSVQFQGAALSDRFLQGEWNNGVTDQTPLTRPWYGGWDNAPLYLVENSWTPENITAKYPRLSTEVSTNNAQLSDHWKVNGAYLRLKNVTLSYDLPKQIIRKVGLGDVRIYASGHNLWTLTEFKYLDPEATSVLQGYYPQQRTFTLGLELSF